MVYSQEKTVELPIRHPNQKGEYPIRRRIVYQHEWNAHRIHKKSNLNKSFYSIHHLLSPIMLISRNAHFLIHNQLCYALVMIDHVKRKH